MPKEESWFSCPFSWSPMSNTMNGSGLCWVRHRSLNTRQAQLIWWPKWWNDLTAFKFIPATSSQNQKIQRTDPSDGGSVPKYMLLNSQSKIVISSSPLTVCVMTWELIFGIRNHQTHTIHKRQARRYYFALHWSFDQDPYFDPALFEKSCIALYDFDGKVKNSLPMKAGEAFLLIAKCDKKGDKSWSLVENERGQRGYVPSSFLWIMSWNNSNRVFYQPSIGSSLCHLLRLLSHHGLITSDAIFF